MNREKRQNREMWGADSWWTLQCCLGPTVPVHGQALVLDLGRLGQEDRDAFPFLPIPDSSHWRCGIILACSAAVFCLGSVGAFLSTKRAELD